MKFLIVKNAPGSSGMFWKLGVMLPAHRRELAMRRTFDFLLLKRHSLIVLNGTGMTVVEPCVCLFGNMYSFHYVIKFNSKTF